MPAFKLFKVEGNQYLAIDTGHGSHVIDIEGNNYGSWLDLGHFVKKLHTEGPNPNILGKAEVRIISK